jgi:membrane-associated phospholipid phosphatase
MISISKRSLLVAIVSARSLAAQRTAGDTVAHDTTATRSDSTVPVLDLGVAAVTQPVHFDRRLAAGLVLGSLALIPLDKSAETWLQGPRLQGSSALQSAANGFNWLGGTGLVAGSVAALAVGRLTGNDRLSEVGLRTTEAIVASGAIVGVAKGLVGRQRPYLEKTDPADFFVGRGFGNGALTSFPSGHTAAAFSAATVLSLEARRTWPRAAPVITPLLYGGATAVGLARMYDSKHWASDVALGATIGTFTGIQVMRFNDAHPENRLARWLTHVSVEPNGTRGVGVGVSLPLR